MSAGLLHVIVGVALLIVSVFVLSELALKPAAPL